MTARSSRAVLRREVNMCAAAARSEQEFFAGLDTAGLLVRLRHSPTQPTQVTGYAVSLPGMTHWDGQQVWYGGQTLDGQLSLGALRRRWQAGRPGTPPAPDAFAAADTRDIFGYATAVAADAARQLRASLPRRSPPTSPGPPPTSSPPPRRPPAALNCSRPPTVSAGRPARRGGASRRRRRAGPRCAPPRTCWPPAPRTGPAVPIARLALISALAGLARAVAKVREAQQPSAAGRRGP